MVEHKEKGSSILRSKKLPVVVSIGAAGVIAAGWGIKSGIEDLRKLLDGDNRPKRTESLEDLKWQVGLSGEISQLDIEYNLLAQRYLDARREFQGLLAYELRQGASSDTQEFIERERVSLVIDGAVLVHDLVDENIIEIDQDAKQVEIKGVKFDLSDLTQLFISDQIINQTLTANFFNNPPEVKLEADRNIYYLFWLASQNLPIIFEDDVFSYPSDAVLIKMSRFYQKMVELGYPLPNQIFFKRYSQKDPGVGWYDPLPLNRIVITEKASDDTSIHEGLHSQASNNPEFPQARFNEVVDWVKANVQGEYNEEDTYINPGVLDKDTPEAVAVEDYAETLKTYLTDGVFFRRILKDLFLRSGSAFDIVQAKYDFAVLFYGGDEYLKDGEIFDPKPGDIFKVDDPDISRSGIPLRPEPIFESKPEFPMVYSQNDVLILEGPKLVVHPKTGREVKMWRVRKVYYYDYYGEVVLTGESGWMWGIWFGDKVKSGDVSISTSDNN